MEEFKNEEKKLKELKEIERRINGFTFHLNENRFEADINRKMKCSNLKIIDTNTIKSIYFNIKILANTVKNIPLSHNKFTNFSTKNSLNLNLSKI